MTDCNITVFDPKRVSFSVNGVPLKRGDYFSDDDSLVLDRAVDDGTAIVGKGGSVLISLTADNTGVLTVKLLPGSTSNIILTNAYNLFRNGLSGASLIQVVITDFNRKQVITSPAGVISRPKRTNFLTASAAEWRFILACTNPNTLNIAS